jgi:predicted RND superfamily exporter protein
MQLKQQMGTKDRIIASVCGGLLIAVTIIMCLVPVIGVSLRFDVSLTAFSNMAFVLSVAFATEYSVHVVHRFLSAPTTIDSARERVEHTMKFLCQPLTLSFLSSSIGVACLAFTDFDFNERFFFRPLMIVMVVTYFIGSFFLPILLSKLDFEFLKVGHKGEEALDTKKVEEDSEEYIFKDDA